MRYLFALLIFLLLFLSSPALHAQGNDPDAPGTLQPTLRFNHFTIEDGLVQNSVQSILQDHAGFIWIGTRDGLSHFDGYQFTTYRHDPTNPQSLSDNEVSDLFEDHEGFLWVATHAGGVNRFDPRQQTFTAYQHEPENPNSLAGNLVTTIFQDRAGVMWFGGGGGSGFTRFDPASGAFTRYTLPPEARSRQVWKIVEDAAGALWLATDAALLRFDPQGGAFEVYLPHEREQHLSGLHLDAQGLVWVGGLTGLYRFDPQTETFTPMPGSPGRIDDLLADQQGILWLATFGEGLHLFDPALGRFTQRYRHDSTDPDSLSDDQLVELYEDAAGVIWVGTANGGLNLIDPLQKRFSSYRHQPQVASSLAEGRVGAVTGNQAGQLWVGSGATLNQIEWPTGQIIHHPTNAPDGTISALHWGSNGTLWVGSTIREVYEFDPSSGQFTRRSLEGQRPPPSAGPPREIRGFYEDETGALWVAIALDGLYRLDPRSGEARVFDPQFPGEEAPRIGEWMSNLVADHAGMIWVGYGNGILSRFDPLTEQFTHYRPEGRSGQVETLHIARDGTIWVGTRSGLLRFDPASEQFRRYTEADGLPNGFVVGIQEDEAGMLWLSSKQGLARLDPQSDTFQGYEASDGLQGNEFMANATWRASDGQLFFGGSNGLTAFYPEQIAPNSYRPPVRLTQFRLSNEPVPVRADGLLQQPIWETPTLTLGHDQMILSFEFAALSYADPAKNRYRYRLEGLESSWNEVGSERRFASYTTLAPGSYTLRVQGSNDDGVWSEQEATLRITVLPPWWQTTWFRALLLIGLVGLLFGGYSWRVRAMARRNALLERQVRERTQELAESEARFRGLASATFEAMLLHDGGKIVDANDMALDLFGYPRAALIGQSLTDLFSPESQSLVMQLWQEEAEAERSHELMALTEAGQRVPVEVRGRELRAAGQAQPVQVAVIRDLTERRQIEGQKQRLATLEERERIGRELHDDLGQVMGYVNNQVQTVQGLLEEGSTLQAQATLGQLAEVVQEAHDDVRQYILGIRTAAPTPLDFRSTLEQYLLQLQQRHGFTVVVNWSDDLELERLAPEVETQLLRIIQEALTNTRKHAGVTRARLLFTSHVDALQVIIADEGVGFESQAVPEGHFGLEIMRERAQAVDGSLKVRSSPEQGTEVIVRVPLMLEQEISETVRGLRILLVDDHPLYLEGLRNMLRARGVHVVGMAQDGLEAQTLAKTLQPDVILMDVEMPRMGGLEATRAIKAELPEIKIVMLTVAAEEETLFDALKEGASGYLLKSLNRKKFFALLSEVMRGETVLSPTLAARVLEEFKHHKSQEVESKRASDETDDGSIGDLTERQQEVLDLLVQDMSNKEIAAHLHVTEQTVKYHVGQILKRLQLRSRYELTHYVQGQSSASEPGSAPSQNR